MALILATLNIEKGMDDRGNVVQPSGEYTSGMLRQALTLSAHFYEFHGMFVSAATQFRSKRNSDLARRRFGHSLDYRVSYLTD